MTTKTVTFTVEVPDDVSDADAEAFFRFELGEVCSLAGDNALADKDIRSLTVRHVDVR